MWEELEDLVLECVLPMAVALCLSQLSRPLSSSSYDGIQDLQGLILDATEPQWFWVAISFTSFEGASHIYLTIPSVTGDCPP